MVEGARLERVYAGNRIEGSNPSLSARKTRQPIELNCNSVEPVARTHNSTHKLMLDYFGTIWSFLVIGEKYMMSDLPEQANSTSSIVWSN